MARAMRVSVVICTRNRPDLIGSAVASVLANTYPGFDVLVVDQSDDDCVAPPDWVESVAAAFAADPEAELLYGQVLLPAALAESMAAGEGTVPTLPIERPQRINRAEGFRLYGMGANFAARRRLFERI